MPAQMLSDVFGVPSADTYALVGIALLIVAAAILARRSHDQTSKTPETAATPEPSGAGSPAIGDAPSQATSPPATPDPTAVAADARVTLMLISLAQQRLGWLDRRVEERTTLCAALLGVNVALAVGTVAIAATVTFPERWWVPIPALVVSSAIAIFPLVWRRTRRADAGPTPGALLEKFARLKHHPVLRGQPDAFELSAYVATLTELRATFRHNRRVWRRTSVLVNIALLLLVADAAFAALFFGLR